MDAHSLAQRILDAQVAFIIQRLRGPGFKDWVEREIDVFLVVIESIALTDVVSAQQIKDTALTYAVDFDIQGAIPEIMGEIASYVYRHPLLDAHRVGDLLSDQQAQDYIRKIVELDGLPADLARALTDNPLYNDMLAALLHQVLSDFVAMNAVTRNLPGVTSMMRVGKDLLGKASPELERHLARLIQRFIRHNLQIVLASSRQWLLAHLPRATLQEVLWGWWIELREQPVASFRRWLSRDDLEDVIVLGFEHWKTLRKAPLYGAVVEAGIDFFFTKYAQTSLRELLAEVGVDKATMMREALRYAPPVIAYLDDAGLLAPSLRRQFADFYQSDLLLVLLGDALTQVNSDCVQPSPGSYPQPGKAPTPDR